MLYNDANKDFVQCLIKSGDRLRKKDDVLLSDDTNNCYSFGLIPFLTFVVTHQSVSLPINWLFVFEL